MGGFRGGGFRGGFGGFRGNGFRGGFGFRNGFRGAGFGGWGWGNGWGWGGGWWPWWGGGWGLGWGWPIGDAGYGWPGYVDNSFDYGYPAGGYAANAGYPSGGYANYAYPQQQSQPNVVVVYPPQQPAAPAYAAAPMIREYDEYGQEIRRMGPPPAPQAPIAAPAESGGAPMYLIAFRNRDIRAAVAYWVNGNTLFYVTREHEQKQVPLDMVDRDLSNRLNQERHVAFALPQAR
jgi:hypothetical protein